MGRPSYKPLEDCRDGIRQYGGHLRRRTDDRDLDKLAESTLTAYLKDIRWFDGWLDNNTPEKSLEEVNSADIYAMISDLDNAFNGTTAYNRFRTIRKLFDFLGRMMELAENPCDEWRDDHGLSKSTEQSKRTMVGEKRAATPDEVDLIEKHVSRHETRDKLIVRLMWQTGIRRGELADLTLDDVSRERREIQIRREVAKNNKPRIVPYQPSLEAYLSQWIDNGDRDALNRKGRDNLVVGERGGKLRGERINEIVRDAADRAGINEVDYTDANGGKRMTFTSHSLRRGYGSYMANRTDMGIWELSKVMGHSSVEVTENRYVNHDERAGVKQAHRYGPS